MTGAELMVHGPTYQEGWCGSAAFLVSARLVELRSMATVRGCELCEETKWDGVAEIAGRDAHDEDERRGHS